MKRHGSKGSPRRPTTIWSSRFQHAICLPGSMSQLVKGRIRAIELQHARRLTRLFTHAPVAVAVLSGPTHIFELTNSKYRELIGGRNVVGRPDS